MGRFLLLTATLLIASCGNEASQSVSNKDRASVLTAATLGEQQVLTNAELLATDPYTGADRTKGERQAQICRACHSLDKGGPNMIGPNLYGFFGRDAGAVEGFGYSSVLQNAGFVWTPRAMDAWLAQPGQFLPGNRMTFAGVPDQASREALIAYLLDVTNSD